MPADDFSLLQPHLEHAVYASGDVLSRPNEPSDYVHFLESGLASQIGAAGGGLRVETAIYGRDGVGPGSLLLGVDRSPYHHLIQMKGEGHKMRADLFAEALNQSRSLQALFLRFTQCVMVQTGYTAISNGSNVLVERLARWLLMCDDRTDDRRVEITQDFLGIMLSVRRAGVSETITAFERQGIIRTKPSQIEILNRVQLEATAAGSYGVPEVEYARLIGPLRSDP